MLPNNKNTPASESISLAGVFLGTVGLDSQVPAGRNKPLCPGCFRQPGRFRTFPKCTRKAELSEQTGRRLQPKMLLSCQDGTGTPAARKMAFAFATSSAVGSGVAVNV